MKKNFAIVLLFFLTNTFVFANEIDKYISQSDFELKSTVAVFAKDKNTKEVLYKKNEQKLLVPASILKLITFGASYLTLGSDYNFETALYKDTSGNYYIKLGADPLLSTNDLVNLFSNQTCIKKLYIDDSIIDKIPYPEGWMEEDMWPYSRAITPYIIDNNTAEILLKRSALETKVEILQDDPYKFSIINELKPSDKHDYKIQKMYGENSSIIGISGTISKDETIKLPVLDPEINFDIRLRKALNKADIDVENKIEIKRLPENAQKIASVSHSIGEVSRKILLNSDNLTAEVVFKVAAAKYIGYAYPAGLDDAKNMVNNVFDIEEDIKITDGSGVSRNNFVNCVFVVECLEKLLKDEGFKNLLATSNQGTLAGRLLFLENNLRAKTGTMANLSSLAGYLTAKSGREVVFAMIVQNSPKRKAVLKNFENNIVSLFYRKF